MRALRWGIFISHFAAKCQMKMRHLLAIAVLAAGGLIRAAEPQAEGRTVTVTFREVDTLFANPARGWMAFHRSPSPQGRFPYSLGYYRWNWADLEPEEGRFHWKPIDDAIDAWKRAEGAVAFRIMTANAHSRGYYCSPKWLFDAGCKSHDYVRGGEDTMEGGKRIPRIEPDYADPIYLAKHGAFLKALGGRYSGHPGVEFLDIGSYGIWGEWHTPHGAPAEVRRRIIDMYVAAFTKTPLVMMSDDAEMLGYALAKGAGLRRDGVGSPWHERNWIGSPKYAGVRGFADAWKTAPVVFEWFGPYDFLLRRKWPFDAAMKFLLDNHVTFLNDNVGTVPESEMPKLLDLGRRAGYRFVLRELSHPSRAPRGSSIQVAMKWSNVGVGRLYRPFALVVYLLDGRGNEACRVEAKADPRAWLPGDHAVAERLPLPATLTPGVYTLALALVAPDSRKPAIQLAIEAPDTGRRYALSRLTVD